MTYYRIIEQVTADGLFIHWPASYPTLETARAALDRARKASNTIAIGEYLSRNGEFIGRADLS